VHVPDRRTAWLVSRYADAAAALKDGRLAKDRRLALGPGERNRPHWIPAFVRPLERNMLDLDPPDHTRLRALVHKAFTPRLVERLADRMRALCNELLDRALSRPAFDLVADFALPLPATIIAELLGVPPSDQRRFHRWSSSVVSASSPRAFVMALPNIWLFLRYMRQLVARRRLEPRDDLLTALIQAEEAGDTMTTDELLAMVFLLLVAGHETTVNLIAAGTLALLDNPEQKARLQESLDLTKTAVEELLRFTSPVQFATERYAREELRIADMTLPRGSLLLVAIGSANHDERQFERPEELDLGRDPNPHLAFGQGAHYCLGAPLARLEGQVAFDTLLQRCPNLRLAIPRNAVRFRRGLFLRSLDHLPVVA
jgi:cytochrome P450